MLPKVIENRLKRINIKSKRRRILLKKVMELKYLCDLDMLFIIKDTEFNKYTIYNSSDQDFDPALVKQLTEPMTLQTLSNRSDPEIYKKKTKYHYVTSTEYDKLVREKPADDKVAVPDMQDQLEDESMAIEDQELMDLSVKSDTHRPLN